VVVMRTRRECSRGTGMEGGKPPDGIPSSEMLR
jgi:hypothetical protein